jgi:hypothetical protein
VKAAAPIAEQYGDGAGVGTVRAGVGDDDVRIAIMIDVGDGNPPWAGPGRNRNLTKVLTVRCQVAGEEEQRELGCNAHGGASDESTQNKPATCWTAESRLSE